MHDPARCKAHSRTGNQCRNPPMAGQTVCRMHGGSSPRALKAAEQRLALQAAQTAVATYGLPRTIDPHTALLEELHRTAGHVAWLGHIVAGLDAEKPGKNGLLESTMFGLQPAIWVKLYKDERKHFADVAKSCVAAGIAERQVQIAEERGRLMADIFRTVFADPDLGLTADQQQRAASVTARHLRLVASGD